MHILVMAKAPVPGRVKTRLCPPCTPPEAAAIAEAALADTLDAVVGSGVDRCVVALDGSPGLWLPAGVQVVAQRGDRFDERLAAAWDDVGGPGLQIGMDTPQVTADLLDRSCAALDQPGLGAVLGPAADGGWWAIGLRHADHRAFLGVPMSRADTGEHQLARLRDLGLAVELLPILDDLDDAASAGAVAAVLPDGSRTAALLAPLLEPVR
jgi:glycosyltransferase A (GT-A) superfamily protein (DUF2064 family)